MLALYEVYLRNSIDRQFVYHFKRQDWYTIFDTDPRLSSLKTKVDIAIEHITNRGETVTKDKIIAELTMGFWVTLFNARYERILWRPLRKVFPNLIRANRQRRTVSRSLNKIRNFRNRIFHHEAISWNSRQLETQYNRIRETMLWMHKDLINIADVIDRFDLVFDEAKAKMPNNW